MGERLKILLSGMLARQPHQGGASWAVLQYLFGLRELGHEVVLVEPVAEGALAPESEVGAYFRSLALGESAALLGEDSRRTLGLPFARLVEFAAGADLLLNISGTLRAQELIEPIAVRAFVDLDPGFNQVWHVQGEAMGFELHNRFVTVGSCVGGPGCAVPTCEREWTTTLPPVALSHWRPASGEAPSREAFTTVGHWRSYGSVEHAGVRYGQRAHSLRGLIDLPGRVSARLAGAGAKRTNDRAFFEFALGIHPDEHADLQALRAHGWRLLDPALVAGTPSDYRAFVRGSKGELCVAKSGYAASRSGWFSDRSACYLASGRPVVAQETGFAATLPTGEGLLSFGSAEEAAEAVGEIEGDYERHCAAARAIAEEHLDARRVLGRLLQRLGTAR
jgi:hypothetical protein